MLPHAFHIDFFSYQWKSNGQTLLSYYPTDFTTFRIQNKRLPLLCKPVLNIAFVYDDELLLFKQTYLGRCLGWTSVSRPESFKPHRNEYRCSQRLIYEWTLAIKTIVTLPIQIIRNIILSIQSSSSLLFWSASLILSARYTTLASSRSAILSATGVGTNS